MDTVYLIVSFINILRKTNLVEVLDLRSFFWFSW